VWSEVVGELGPRIRGYARAKGAPDPDDVMQDVFVAAAERIDDFVGDERSFRSWIFSIAYRQIANRHRASGRETPVETERMRWGTAPGADEPLERDDSVSAAVAAMHVLNDVERDVVLMRVVAELDTDEVAAAVDKSPGNVRVIQTRALAKLREELERTGYVAGGGR